MRRLLLLLPVVAAAVVAAVILLTPPAAEPPAEPGGAGPGRAEPAPRDEPVDPLPPPPPLGDAFVRGRVVDAADRPVPGARVVAEVLVGAAAALRAIGIEDGLETTAVEAVADPDASFRIEGLPPGELTIVATAEGMTSEEIETAAPVDGLTIRLVATGGVRAVVEAEGAETVHLCLLPGYHRAEGPPGPFTIRDVPEGRYLLKAVCEGFCPARTAPFEVKAGRANEAPPIRLVPGTLVSGTVRAPDGRDLFGARVDFERKETSGLVSHTTWYGAIPVDEDGAFRRRVPPGRWRIRAGLPGHVTARDAEGRGKVEVGDEPVTIDFVLTPHDGDAEPEEEPSPPSVVLTGRIVDEGGRPLPNAAVRWGHEHAFAETDGTFRIECPNRPDAIVYTAAGFPPGVYAPKAEFTPGTHALGDLPLDRRGGVSVVGRVADERGVALEGVRVKARFETHELTVYEIEARTGADGRYRIRGPLLAECEVVVWTRVEGYGGESARVTAAPVATADLELTPRTPRATATGVVRFPAEVPDNVDIEVEAMEGRSTGSWVTWNPATGRWSCTLDPGRHVLWVGAVGYAPCRAGEFKARAGETVEAPVARLGRGGTVEGVVKNRDGSPAANRQISIRYREQRVFQQTIRKDGTFRFEHVPPGVYPITAGTRGKTVRSEVSVAEGAATWLELRPTD